MGSHRLIILFILVLSAAAVHAEDAALTKQFYEAAVRAQPNNANALYDLGNAYFIDGRYADALAQYEKAGSIGLAAARMERYCFNLSVCYAKLGRNEDAIRAIESCLKINPGNDNAQALLKIYKGREEALSP